MRGAKPLQTEVERLVLSTADAAEVLRDITALLCRRTRSRIALLARWEDGEHCTTLLAHPGLSAPLADQLCAALAPYRAECLRSDQPLSVAALDQAVVAALPDELRASKIGRLLVVPLHKAGKPLGLLVLARRTASFGAAANVRFERHRGFATTCAMGHASAMALKATADHWRVALSDVDRGVYETLDLRLTAPSPPGRSSRTGHGRCCQDP